MAERQFALGISENQPLFNIVEPDPIEITNADFFYSKYPLSKHKVQRKLCDLNKTIATKNLEK